MLKKEIDICEKYAEKERKNREFATKERTAYQWHI